MVREAATFIEEAEWTESYTPATVAPLPRWVDAGQPGSQFEMVAGIRAVVAVEAPVHLTLVHQRLRDAWNIGRVGPRIRDNIEAAIRLAEVIRDGEFLLGPQTVEAVRAPTGTIFRSIEQVHDEELGLALRNLVHDAGGIGSDDLTQAVARIFGWTRRGPDIATRLSGLIDDLVANGSLRRDGDALT